MRRWLTTTALSGVTLAALSSPSAASETQSYTYDALGRLVAVQYSGSINNGQAHSLCYDPAGNRTQYKSSAAGGLASCSGGSTPTPTPGPTPTPSNSPPVANPDSLSAPKCVMRSKDVIANDTDPNGNYPLSLVGVDQDWAWVSSGTTIGMTTPSANGTYYINYTVADSLGATSNGTLTVTISGTQQCV